MQLSIFDFDGTLFASPDRPDWWPLPGYWSRPESLSPPYVPARPGPDWWSGAVVSAARRAMSDGYTVLLTGRHQRVGHRIKDLLHGEGLRFDDYFFSPGDEDTLPFKSRVIVDLVERIEPEQVILWDDREEHVKGLEAQLKALGVPWVFRRVQRIKREFENVPLAEKVARRFQAALDFKKNDEALQRADALRKKLLRLERSKDPVPKVLGVYREILGILEVTFSDLLAYEGDDPRDRFKQARDSAARALERARAFGKDPKEFVMGDNVTYGPGKDSPGNLMAHASELAKQAYLQLRAANSIGWTFSHRS
jgi:hypothetical protein